MEQQFKDLLAGRVPVALRVPLVLVVPMVSVVDLEFKVPRVFECVAYSNLNMPSTLISFN